MRHVKLFEAFSTPKPLTEDQKIWLDKCAKGWSLNPLTGLVDVDGNFDCLAQSLTDFKGVRFGHVKGIFRCINNQLTSLVGAPKTIGTHFACTNNQLTSLEGAPKIVNGNFHCNDNQLTSLEGAPKTVGWGFYCGSNQLTSLVGAPKTVNGDFDCGSNQLTSLDGAPQTVGGYLHCSNNQLTSLEGAPKTVKGNLYCANNQLTSLDGAPGSVGGNFNCRGNEVSEETLASIFSLMKNGKSYQQALEEFWPDMDNDDRSLMYKDHSSLTPEESRRYDALATVNRIKKYL